MNWFKFYRLVIVSLLITGCGTSRTPETLPSVAEVRGCSARLEASKFANEPYVTPSGRNLGRTEYEELDYDFSEKPEFVVNFQDSKFGGPQLFYQGQAMASLDNLSAWRVFRQACEPKEVFSRTGPVKLPVWVLGGTTYRVSKTETTRMISEPVTGSCGFGSLVFVGQTPVILVGPTDPERECRVVNQQVQVKLSGTWQLASSSKFQLDNLAQKCQIPAPAAATINQTAESYDTTCRD